jgi:flagellar biosynthetic protein FliR
MEGLLGNPATWTYATAKLIAWMLVLTRITGLLAAIPGLGNEQLPLQVRAGFAALLALVISPTLPPMKNIPTGIWDFTAVMSVELAVGLLMGTLVALVFSAVSFGANLIDIQTGFSFVQFVNPVDPQPAAVAGTLLAQVTLLLFFASGLHHQMILALADSYRLVPMGGTLKTHGMELVVLTGGLLAKGFQMAAPVLFALFLVDVLEGFAARFMPQLQLLQLSFPLKISIGIIILGFLMMELPGWLRPLFNAVPGWTFWFRR